MNEANATTVKSTSLALDYKGHHIEGVDFYRLNGYQFIFLSGHQDLLKKKSKKCDDFDWVMYTDSENEEFTCTVLLKIKKGNAKRAYPNQYFIANTVEAAEAIIIHFLGEDNYVNS